MSFLNPKTPPSVFTLLLMAGISAATLNIYAPSLPTMAREFDVSYTIMQISISAYLILSGFVQLFVGPLSDRFGRRRISCWCFGIFAIASFFASVATTLEAFFIFRFLQATSVAGFVLSRIMIRDVHGPDRAASIIGYVTMGMSLVPMFAPILGGIIESYFGWRGSFFILFLLGFIMWIFLIYDAGETIARKNSDIWVQFRGIAELSRIYRFWGYTGTSAMGIGCFFTFLGGAPLTGDMVYGLSPAQIGIAMGFPPLGYLIGNGISGLISQRFGVSKMVVMGAALQSAFLGLALIVLIALPNMPWLYFACYIGIGLGNGIVLPNSNVGVMNLRPHLAGSAAGISGAVTTLFGACFSYFITYLLVKAETAFLFAMTLFIIAALSSLIAYATLQREKKKASTD